MDKLLEAISKYGAGLTFYLIGIVQPSEDERGPLRLEHDNPELLIYATLCLVLGGFLYPFANGDSAAQPGSKAFAEVFGVGSAVLGAILAACVYWAIQAVLIYIAIGTRAGSGAFVDVVSSVLRVFPAVFLIASAAEFVAKSVVGRFDAANALWSGVLAFVLVQVALILWRLPRSLAAAAWMTQAKRRIGAAIAVTLTLGVDVFAIYAPNAAAEPAGPTAFEVAQAAQKGGPKWWCIPGLPCPDTPGHPPGAKPGEWSDQAASTPAASSPSAGAQDFVLNAGDRIYFKSGSSAIAGDAKSVLDAQAAWLARNPAAKVRVEGNGDQHGSRETNLAIGARRASSVRDYLIEKGVASDRITALSLGKERLIDPTSGKASDARNRNAQVVIEERR